MIKKNFRPGEIFEDPESGVKIIGYFDYPSRMAQQSSNLFSVNMSHLFEEFCEIPLKKG
jgi:NAD/NADP transhydrogenase alpha subunit